MRTLKGIRIEDSLIKDINRQALMNNRSFNNQVETMLKEYIKQLKAEGKFK